MTVREKLHKVQNVLQHPGCHIAGWSFDDEITDELCDGEQVDPITFAIGYLDSAIADLNTIGDELQSIATKTKEIEDAD